MRELKFKGLYELSGGERLWTYYGVGSKPVLVGAHWVGEDLQYTGLHDQQNKEFTIR